MSIPVILDTGPLLAFLNRNDQHHRWAVSAWEQADTPFITCESVITEAVFLIRNRLKDSGESVMALLDQGIIKIEFSMQDNAAALQRLLKKYASRPMDLGDACLVRMTELYPKSSLLTVDSDFGIYRRNGRQVIPTIMPE